MNTLLNQRLYMQPKLIGLNKLCNCRAMGILVFSVGQNISIFVPLTYETLFCFTYPSLLTPFL